MHGPYKVGALHLYFYGEVVVVWYLRQYDSIS